jgi:DNA-directed RNA polymerase specialized sigma24 family protein
VSAEEDAFDAFVQVEGERLRRVLVARHGVDIGSDLAAEALAYGWEHWVRVGVMDNPVGYLFRVAESGARRHRRWRRSAPFPPERPLEVSLPADVGLHRALARLGLDQRACVVLVHVFGWSYADVAAVLALTVPAARNHVHRGLRNLRAMLEGS